MFHYISAGITVFVAMAFLVSAAGVIEWRAVKNILEQNGIPGPPFKDFFVQFLLFKG